MKQFKGGSEQGFVLIATIILTVFFLTIGVAVYSFSINHFVSVRRSLSELQAFSLADAGAEEFMSSINADSNYSGTGGPITLFSDNANGKGTYETTVANGISGEKIITSTGKIYFPATAANPKVTRKVRVVIKNANSEPYSVSSGPGGLILDNNTAIASGSVYVNGYITLNNNATIGSAASLVPVWVAYNICPVPADSTYPKECTSEQATKPVNFGNSSSHIYGNIRANWPGRSPGYDNVHMTNNGLVATSGIQPVGLPFVDRQANKDAICPGGTCSTIASPTANCPNQTWAANSKISGDVAIPNNCTVTVNGNIWITGKLTTGNGVTLKPGASVTNSPEIMIDCAGCNSSTAVGSLSFGNSNSLPSNANNIGFHFITYWNAAGNPDVTSLTGSNLSNSQDIVTISPGNNITTASRTLFFARWSRVNISNNGVIGAVSGQTVKLNNNGSSSYTFDGTEGSGQRSWVATYYQPIY